MILPPPRGRGRGRAGRPPSGRGRGRAGRPPSHGMGRGRRWGRPPGPGRGGGRIGHKRLRDDEEGVEVESGTIERVQVDVVGFSSGLCSSWGL
jgi:hypothetical protein